MKQKLIFFDIDGTLWDHIDGIRDSAIQAIKMCRNNGHLVYLCTGRTYGTIPEPVKNIHFDGCIAGGGCYISCNGTTIENKFIDNNVVNDTISLFQKNDIAYNVETLNKIYMSEPYADYLLKKDNRFNNISSEIKRAMELNGNIELRNNIDEFLTHPAPASKMCIITHKNKVKKIQSQFSSALQYIEHELPDDMINGELISKGYNKGTAIEKVCSHIGFSIENTLCFGDSMNDLDMIKICGTSIVMGNGTEKLKQYADIVCGAMNEEGIFNQLQSMKII